MASLEDILQERAEKFRAWQESSLTELVGRGNYSRVYATSGGLAAAKVAELPHVSRSARRQAFREHVISLLQTLLVLKRASFFFPLHYGVQLSTGADRGEPSMARTAAAAELTLFMESFPGALPQLAPRVLLTQERKERASGRWLALAFQLMHAVLAMSISFGISHNDLYPRNVLVRPLPEGCDVVFETVVEGVSYRLVLPFLAVVTDYGVASGQLLGGKQEPEVCRSLEELQVPRNFALRPPSAHILQYRGLPAFSRDPWVLLKWLCYPCAELPTQPWGLRLWALDALKRLEAQLSDFSSARAQLPLFHHIFHGRTLRSFFEEPLFVTPCEETPEEDAGLRQRFCISEARGRELLREATSVLARMQSILPPPSARPRAKAENQGDPTR